MKTKKKQLSTWECKILENMNTCNQAYTFGLKSGEYCEINSQSNHTMLGLVYICFIVVYSHFYNFGQRPPFFCG